MKPEEKLELIEEEIKLLSAKQIALQKQQTLYQRLFVSDHELVSVNTQIADLKKREENYFKVIQNAASVSKPDPEKDWSKVPFYWNRLTKLGLVTPAEQINAYTSFVGGIVGLGYAGSNFYKAHHLFKLTHCTPGTDQYTYHWARARATPQQIELASYWIGRFKLRGFAALGAPLLFVIYLGSKRKL